METDESTAVTQSLLSLSENSSAARIRTLELNEYCKHAKTNLKVLKTKIHSLLTINNDAVRTRNELLARKSINAINLKSLIQTRNEFYNFKCDAKIDYVEEEVTLKNKRMKYDEFTRFYQDKWQAFEGEYNQIGMVSEISMLQGENASLNAELIKLQRLLNKTKKDYFWEMLQLKNSLINKIVEFITEYQLFSKFLIVNQNIRKITVQTKKMLKDQQDSQNLKPRFKANFLKKNILQLHTERVPNQQAFADSFSMHLQELDNIILPLDNLPLEVLENSNEEYSFANVKDVSTNLNTTRNFDMNIRNDFSPTDNPNGTLPRMTMDSENNAEKKINKDSTSLTTGENIKAQDFSASYINNTPSVFCMAQCNESLSSPLHSADVSEYWAQTHDKDRVEDPGLLISARKLHEKQSHKQREEELPNEQGEANVRNSNKKKHSMNMADGAAPSIQPPQNPNSINLTSEKCAEIGVQRENKEKQSQNPEKEVASRTGLWIQNQPPDQIHDQDREENLFSFFSGSSTRKANLGSGSSIFTLF